MLPIGNVCYNIQKRSHTAMGLSCWWYVIVRFVIRVVTRSATIGEDRTTSGSHKRSIVRSIVAPYDRSYDRSYYQSWNSATDSVGRHMESDYNPRNICTRSVSEQPIGGTTGRKVTRPVARLIVRPLKIWNSRFQSVKMTIELVATDLPLAITHDLCDQSHDLCHQLYVISTMCPGLQHFSIAGRS